MKGINWEYFNKYKNINDKYLPDVGEGDNKATQVITAINKLIYKWYNDGDVFDNSYYLEGWANDLSSYANWLYYNIPKASNILNKIKDIGFKYEYEHLLAELANLLFDEDKLKEWENEPKEDSIYNCDGPFIYISYNDEYYWDDYEDECYW